MTSKKELYANNSDITLSFTNFDWFNNTMEVLKGLCTPQHIRKFCDKQFTSKWNNPSVERRTEEEILDFDDNGSKAAHVVSPNITYKIELCELQFALRCVIDRSGFLQAPEGLSFRELQKMCNVHYSQAEAVICGSNNAACEIERRQTFLSICDYKSITQAEKAANIVIPTLLIVIPNTRDILSTVVMKDLKAMYILHKPTNK